MNSTVIEPQDHGRFARYLAGSEEIVHACRRHWIVLGRQLLVWLATLVAAVLLSVLAEAGGERAVGFQRMATLAFLGMTLYLVFHVVEWWYERIVITNKRVIKTEGILTRKVSTLPLGKVTDTAYRRTLLGRLLGYGDLVLDLPGQDKYVPVLNKLSHPDEIYQTIMSIAIGGGRPAPPPKPRTPPSEADTGPIPVVEDV